MSNLISKIQDNHRFTVCQVYSSRKAWRVHVHTVKNRGGIPEVNGITTCSSPTISLRQSKRASAEPGR